MVKNLEKLEKKNNNLEDQVNVEIDIRLKFHNILDFLEEENRFPRDIEHSSHILSEILLDPSIVDTTITASNGSSSKFNLLL